MMTRIYESVRKDVKTGDLFFTASDSLISRIIRFFTRSKVSHTGMFVWTKWEGKDRLMVVEYIPSGFHTTFASRYIEECKKNGEAFFFGELSEERKTKEYKILKNVEKYSGGQYDTAGALLSLFRPKSDNDFYCSEFVAEVLMLKKNTGRGGFTPDDLANLCVEFKKIV